MKVQDDRSAMVMPGARPRQAATPTLKLTAPVPDELSIHECCARALDYLLQPPAVWISLGIGAIKLAPAEMARLTRIGIKAGWPDLLIIYGGIYGVELKRPGGALSKTRILHNKRGRARVVIGQTDMFPVLLKAGFEDIAVCTSVDQVLSQIRRWHIPLRGDAT